MQNVALKLSHGIHKLRTNSIIHRIQHLSMSTERLESFNNGKMEREEWNRYSYCKVSAGYDISISSTSENSEHALSNHKNRCRFQCRHICEIFLLW